MDNTQNEDRAFNIGDKVIRARSGSCENFLIGQIGIVRNINDASSGNLFYFTIEVELSNGNISHGNDSRNLDLVETKPALKSKPIKIDSEAMVKDAIVNYHNSTFRILKENYEKNKKTLSVDIENLNSSILVKEENLKELEFNFVNKKELNVKDLNNQIEEIRKHPLVENVGFFFSNKRTDYSKTPLELVVKTKRLRFKKERILGKYEIRINFDSGFYYLGFLSNEDTIRRIVVENEHIEKFNSNHKANLRHHFHIGSYICFGNGRELAIRCLENCKLYDLINFIIDYIQTQYNENDAIVKKYGFYNMLTFAKHYYNKKKIDEFNIKDYDDLLVESFNNINLNSKLLKISEISKALVESIRGSKHPPIVNDRNIDYCENCSGEDCGNCEHNNS